MRKKILVGCVLVLICVCLLIVYARHGNNDIVEIKNNVLVNGSISE